MTTTKPRATQIQFSSSVTGEHDLDTYLEEAEIGGKTLASLLSQIFSAATGTPILLSYRSVFAPSTAYYVNDVVRVDYVWYICTTPHTSSASIGPEFTSILDYSAIATHVSDMAATATSASGAATASAAAALVSENNAAASEAAAAVSESNAAASSASANSSKDAAAASASSASASAGTATTKASEASTSAANASDSAAAAAGSASSASASATTATTKASEASTGAATATAKAADATGAASTAIQARDKAQQWASEPRGVPVEDGEYSAKHWAQEAADLADLMGALDLAAIDKVVIASTSLVDACIYDTSKDSDGGAWRMRCQHTRWYWETIYGEWLGSASSEAAARAISGATTNCYYYDTALAQFRALLAGSGATTVYRGNVREFPARVLITAETSRVVIWDLTQPGCPMWMVFMLGSSGSANRMLGRTAITGVAAQAGTLCAGHATSGIEVDALTRIDFASDAATIYPHSSSFYSAYPQQCGAWSTGIAARNTAGGYTGRGSALLAHYKVSDVAITVLPDAPIDIATGLPVPTIAVATDGNSTHSISVIKQDGTVVNIGADDATRKMLRVHFNGASLHAVRDDGTVYVWNDVTNITTGAAPNATYSAASIPALLGTASKTSTSRAFGSSIGLTRLKDDPSTPAKGLVAAISTTFSSGFMPGDIRGAWITAADGVTETLTGGSVLDRSIKNNGLVINGSLNKAPVAAGAALCALSGFSATNYLEQAYSANLDFGTGDFCLMGWGNCVNGASTQNILSRISPAGAIRFYLQLLSDERIRFTIGTDIFTSTDAVPTGTPLFIVATRRNGQTSLQINCEEVANGASAFTATGVDDVLRIGVSAYDKSGPFAGSLALWRISATAPSADQIRYIYETEKRLFDPGAQCTIAGTSNAVTALTYDEDTDLLHAGTSWGRSAFQGLLRVSSEDTPVGSINALAASGGAIAQAGATAADIHIPAYSLREELVRLSGVPAKSDSAAKLTHTTTAISKTLAANEICTVTAPGLTITLPPKAAGIFCAVVTGNFEDTIIDPTTATLGGEANTRPLNVANRRVDFRCDGSDWSY